MEDEQVKKDQRYCIFCKNCVSTAYWDRHCRYHEQDPLRQQQKEEQPTTSQVTEAAGRRGNLLDTEDGQSAIANAVIELHELIRCDMPYRLHRHLLQTRIPHASRQTVKACMIATRALTEHVMPNLKTSGHTSEATIIGDTVLPPLVTSSKPEHASGVAEDVAQVNIREQQQPADIDLNVSG